MQRAFHLGLEFSPRLAHGIRTVPVPGNEGVAEDMVLTRRRTEYVMPYEAVYTK